MSAIEQSTAAGHRAAGTGGTVGDNHVTSGNGTAAEDRTPGGDRPPGEDKAYGKGKAYGDDGAYGDDRAYGEEPHAVEPHAVERSRTVAVVGAGAMGQGIAQVALTAGHPVLLHDIAPGRAAEATAAIGTRLDRLVARGKMEPAARDAAVARLRPAHDLGELSGSALVVEAVVERLDVKQALFRALEEIVADDCLLATNTSSLSVTAVAAALKHPGRAVGLHFFNPAPLLPLVEVVSGHATEERTAARAHATAAAWGKTPVRCADLPGFIVNRVARPFYAEGFAIHEDRGADPATIDAVLRECGGFRMGPFELTDLIGQDVNEAVTHSVWESFFRSAKFTPSLAQRRLVEAGLLGRKSGRGWYDYAEGAARPEPHTAAPAAPPAYVIAEGDRIRGAEGLLELIAGAGVTVRTEGGEESTVLELPSGGRLALADGLTSAEFDDVVHFDLALDYRTATRIALSASPDTGEHTLEEAIGLFQALGKKVSVIGDVPGMIVARTVAMLIDAAADAVAKGVASDDGIDTAMRLGVNYPLGPLEWNRRLPRGYAHDLLEALDSRVPGGRYAPSLALFQRTSLIAAEGADS
ncbi:3-hydroxyacyl-CoA dehydrogenase [Streptomyces katsurahamanus]|uniref:3-hydroxyacyl-CoA dehydrogenase n=1 Tax=Streptomyces katsurahamanus TaxID=2577098 RepID=A0ABW9NPY7_9ACTN|nr:3-hydroxyacyl-CoA dehydrogenase [Streptomyces katsurahamanus]MQS35382.1 3-hydroxyacyl-CoA dehydrogenase [Streptomyces katsurahamanus]